MSELPILKAVLDYTKENNKLFCMPGHKAGKGFLFDKNGQEFLKNIIECDLTEVDGLDNLHNPCGIIKHSMELLSDFYDAKKSYYLVNGSTSGNLAMIFSSFEEGDKILVERNCHKSIYNAIIMRKLKPVYINNIVYDKFNAPMALDVRECLNLINNTKDIKGIILTYPNYYGVCSNIEPVIEEAKKHNIKVLIDSAHGAHFSVTDKLPKSALRLGADMVVMSSHKTLPSLTQTAFLHINRESSIDVNKVDFYVSCFLSTSPSYLFLCSMDYSRYYLSKYGKTDYDNLVDISEEFRNKINALGPYRVLGKSDLDMFNKEYQNVKEIDLTRFTINLKSGFSGHKLLEFLKSKKIQCEMCDFSNVVLILSPFFGQDQLQDVYDALKDLNLESIKSNGLSVNFSYTKNEKVYMPYEVINKKCMWVDLKKSEGMICYESIIPYPPGVPIIMPGEKINIQLINQINDYINYDIEIIGIKEGKIKVILEENMEE